MWFSVWMPALLQLGVPLLLVAAAVGAGRLGRARTAVALLAYAYLVAIGIAGLWLIAPWWLPYSYGVLLAVGTGWSWRGTVVARVRGRGVRRIAAGVSVTGTMVLAAVVWLAIGARQPPATPLDLAMPLDGGTYLVVNGGGHVLVNAHLATLEGQRFRAYRGQSYGVDLVRIDRAGFRAPGLLPEKPAAYLIYGDAVLAPCSGRVVVAADGAPDMAPPHADRSRMAGNHVVLDCGGTWVLLGHLQPGSIVPRVGQAVAVGERLGRVGNSGNTTEPHLHVHAQRPGTVDAPLGGAPVPIRLAGRYVARNDRLRSR